MKNFLLFLSMLLAAQLQAQNSVIHTCPTMYITLDPNQSTQPMKPFIWINQSQPQNLWQIGHVSKAIFNSGYSGVKALVTDTLNQYPANNTSSFELKMTNCYPACCNIGVYVSFTHRYDTEAGVDGGTVEISTDHSYYSNVVQSAQPWNGFYTVSDAVTSINSPGFSGSSNGWMSSGFLMMGGSFSDTLWVRFTFGSNGSVSGDGWMIGQIEVQAYSEGVENFGHEKQVLVSPNPVLNEIRLKSQSGSAEFTDVAVYDNMGRKVIGWLDPKGNLLDVSSLPAGFYLLRYTEGDVNTYSRFIKQ